MGQQFNKWQNCLSSIAYVPLSIICILNLLRGLWFAKRSLGVGSSVTFWLLWQEPILSRGDTGGPGCCGMRCSAEETEGH